MPTHSIRVNNHPVELATPPNDTVVPAKRILKETRWHHMSFALHADRYADAPADETPALLDERAGEVLDEVDIAEREMVVVQHKFRD